MTLCVICSSRLTISGASQPPKCTKSCSTHNWNGLSRLASIHAYTCLPTDYIPVPTTVVPCEDYHIKQEAEQGKAFRYKCSIF